MNNSRSTVSLTTPALMIAAWRASKRQTIAVSMLKVRDEGKGLTRGKAIGAREGWPHQRSRQLHQEQFWMRRFGGCWELAITNEANKMARDEHNKAAEHHENAAKAHRSAAEHHGKGDHAKGKEHAGSAKQHSQTANQHSDQAHAKSQQQK
jgi:hypothetical protein